MQLNHSQKNYFLVGKRGHGKTTLAKQIIKQVAKEKKLSVIILDSENEYTDTANFEFPDIPLFVAHIDRHGLKPGKVYNLQISEEISFYDFFDIIEDLRDVFFVYEEASKFTSPSYIPREIFNSVMYGRRKNQFYLVITRRPAEISKHLSSQCDLLYALRVSEVRDVTYLKNYLTKDEIEQVQHLEKPLYKNGKLKSLYYIKKEI